MFNPFNIIRELARKAVVDGISDGVAEAAPIDGDDDPPANLADLAKRLQAARQPALPAAEQETENAPAKRRGK